MIIFRYITREILTTMLAVSIVLLMVIISARFVSYLAEAAAGKLDGGVLLTLMAYRLPAYLELILPLGLFLGIMLAHGRMYLESEMTVLFACGFSQRQLVMYTFIASLGVSMVVGFFSLYLGPQGVRASETLLAQQRSRTDFETLKPARFHELDGGSGISYAEAVSEDRMELQGVFMANVTEENMASEVAILTAEKGRTVLDTGLGRKYLLLKNGRRYIGTPGNADYKVVEFKEYYQLLPEPDYAVNIKRETDGLSTFSLMGLESNEAKAALQWRLSVPILVLVVGLLAVPLAKTQPRQGRYAKMLPAIIIYIFYLVGINVARGMVEEGKEPVPGMYWVVHGIFVMLAVLLITQPWRMRRG